MATVPGDNPFELREEIARIDRERAEFLKLLAESRKLLAEQLKLSAEQMKLRAETEFMPRSMIFQAMLATAALLGAGAAIAKLFFS